MNRIFRLLKRHGRWQALDVKIDLPATNPSSPFDANEASQSICSFCGKKISNDCEFRVYAMRCFPPAALCNACIDAYSVFSTFYRYFGIWFESKPNYAGLRGKLKRRLAGEDGSQPLKDAVITICIYVLQRASAILGGCPHDHCRKTGVPLKRLPRYAIVGDFANAMELMSLTCKEIGLFFRPATQDELASGEAFQKLTDEQANGDTKWARHGIICCSEYIGTNAQSMVVYLCEQEKGLPPGLNRFFTLAQGDGA